jgi:hypothetical protein
MLNMKLRVVGIIGIILLIVACTPPVVFDQAYPIGEEDLEVIPSAYMGSFICESDSSLLLIKKHEVVIRTENFFDLPLKDVDERDDCNIDGQEMYVSGREECIPLEFVNDSTVRGTIIEHDTLFSMGKSGIVRMYQGHVVMSQEIHDDQWAVSFLSLEKNTDIKYRAISDKTKIANVGKVTKMENITTKEDKNNRYKIKPTMKQFDELFNDEKVFIECEYLTRVFLVPEKP